MLREVRAHQQEMDAIRENYTFHRIRRTDEVDANGTVKNTTTLEREIFFVNGREIGRTVRKNGVALSAQEAKSEDSNVRKLVQNALREIAKTGPGPNRNPLIGDILAVSKISNPRRLILNGRSTLAYDFKGDPNAHVQDPHDTLQNAAKKMAGTIWFDETDRQVARLEVTLDDNFKIGGGLLGNVRKGTTLRVEQSPVGQGLWMQTSNEQHLDIRIVVKGLRQNIHVQDSDFKRFDVGTIEKVGTPK